MGRGLSGFQRKPGLEARAGSGDRFDRELTTQAFDSLAHSDKADLIVWSMGGRIKASALVAHFYNDGPIVEIGAKFLAGAGCMARRIVQSFLDETESGGFDRVDCGNTILHRNIGFNAGIRPAHMIADSRLQRFPDRKTVERWQ